jgi:hypothetical protein
MKLATFVNGILDIPDRALDALIRDIELADDLVCPDCGSTAVEPTGHDDALCIDCGCVTQLASCMDR